MDPPFIISFFTVFLCLSLITHNANSATNPTDLKVLQDLLSSVSNPTALSSWTGTDPCGSNWDYVSCSGSRVTQLQLKNAGLRGTLPASINTLSSLEQIALQGNSFSGALPSFNGLSQLTTAYLGGQSFTSIPADFFTGLNSLSVLTLEDNPLNSSGWTLPQELGSCTSLTMLSLTNTSLTGSIPEFLGELTSLQDLRLAYNTLSGSLPASFANLTQLTRLELNNQGSPGPLTGPIAVVGNMPSLKILWLQVNGFTGTIPSSLGAAVSLQECKLNDNQLVGLIPNTFASSQSLQVLTVQNNQLMGPIPALQSSVSSSNYTYSGNEFCVSEIGVACSEQVNALLSFLGGVNWPSKLINSWTGDDPCASWQGITCDTQGKNVTVLNLPKSQLTGLISDDLGNVTSVTKIILSGNNLTGTIPESLTKLPNLVLLDVSDNDIYGPVPTFDTTKVQVILTGNVNINKIMAPTSSPSSDGSTGGGVSSTSATGSKSKVPVGVIAGVIIAVAIVLLVASILGFLLYKRKKQGFLRVQSPNTVYVGPTNGTDGSEMVKITVTPSNGNGVHAAEINGNTDENVQVLEAGNLIISIQLLKNVTNNFSEENVLGRGGFGVVYKGVLDDGTKIAVKRMLSSAVTNKGLDEFQAEIAVLTKVRHRHLVALLGYCIEGNEKLLVYEYMPNGALSQHLFEYKSLGFPPLSWDRRLSIALDMARGIEYLHGLAQQSFIHRDLKPSNVLLGDDYRAKVADFGLVKLAPEGKTSVETRLAGTFGYLAPEYAITGRVTTKSDVFSFGVMLMELITGRKALDESRPEESMHLVTWFRRLIGNKDALLTAVDPVIEVNEVTTQSIIMVAELSGHCTAREAHKRPDMSHAVNVLSPLVEQWKPNEMAEDDGGIDLDLTLPQALKKWQEFEGTSMAGGASQYMDNNTKVSIASMPAYPDALPQTFTSTDGR